MTQVRERLKLDYVLGSVTPLRKKHWDELTSKSKKSRRSQSKKESSIDRSIKLQMLSNLNSNEDKLIVSEGDKKAMVETS